MLARIAKGLRRGERGITGLETAIILIAFLVVASVFAYTILSAGIVSTEKSKESVFAGLGVVQSAMGISGPVIAKDTNSDGTVDQIVFTATTTGGGGIDLKTTTDTNGDGLLSDEASKVHVTIISYVDKRQKVDDIAWTKVALGKNDNDDVLEEGERFQITVKLAGLTTSLTAYGTFTLEVRPGHSSPLIIERSVPAVVDPVMDLR